MEITLKLLRELGFKNEYFDTNKQTYNKKDALFREVVHLLLSTSTQKLIFQV